jgi:hypothetical protein
VTWEVIWMPPALQSLADLWLAAGNRNAVTAASFAIDRLLELSPDTLGVVRFDTVREYAHPPLAVEFEVIAADRRVLVLDCWDAATGRPAPTGN